MLVCQCVGSWGYVCVCVFLSLGFSVCSHVCHVKVSKSPWPLGSPYPQVLMLQPQDHCTKHWCPD